MGASSLALLAAAGHRVYVSARNTDALAALVADYPRQLVALPCDVSDDLSMQAVFSALPEAQRPQQLDGLILSAGTCEYVDLPELDMASFRRVTDVNFCGVVNACKAALPLLQTAARQPYPGQPVARLVVWRVDEKISRQYKKTGSTPQDRPAS